MRVRGVGDFTGTSLSGAAYPKLMLIDNVNRYTGELLNVVIFVL